MNLNVLVSTCKFVNLPLVPLIADSGRSAVEEVGKTLIDDNFKIAIGVFLNVSDKIVLCKLKAQFLFFLAVSLFFNLNDFSIVKDFINKVHLNKKD